MNDWPSTARIKRSGDSLVESAMARSSGGRAFFMEGSVYGNIKYKFQYDFASSDPFPDAYIQLRKLPMAGNFTVGHFKEPFSLEELTSSKYITFMERSLPNVFSSGRNLGVRLNRAFMDKRATAAFGFFREGNPADTDTTFGNSGTYNATTRLTMLPWYVEKAGNSFTSASLTATPSTIRASGFAFVSGPKPTSALGSWKPPGSTSRTWTTSTPKWRWSTARPRCSSSGGALWLTDPQATISSTMGFTSSAVSS